MQKAVLAIGVAACALANAANAQLIVGVDAGLGNVCAWHVDIATNTATALWNDTDAWGLTADDPNGKIYCNDGTPMHVWSYGAGPTTTNLGNPVSTVDGASILFASLASDPNVAGRLFGGRNSNTTTNPEGIYTIDVSVTPPQVTPFFIPGVTSYDWGGMGYDPVGDKFYMTSDMAPTGVGAGLFEIDANAGTITKLSGYPNGETDVDGCEVFGGKVWLITDDAGDEVYTWDIALGMYVPSGVSNPTVFTEVFAAGGYAPSLTFGAPPSVYCTAGTTTHGCVPTISASGQPSVSMSVACQIDVAMVEGEKNGLIFYGIDNTGFTPAAWGAGTSFLCVKAPTQRTPAQFSNGTNGVCDGALTLDWNAYQFGNPAALGNNPWAVGDKVYVQGWFRDPAAAKTTNLSGAVEMTYAP